MDTQQEIDPRALSAPADMAVLDGWITRAQAGDQMGVSQDTLARWETQRKGPPCIRLGRKVYYRIDAIRDWMREQETRKTRGRV